MSEPKYTPGPWSVEELSEDHFLETNHKYAIAGGPCGRVAKVEGWGEVYRNTARLIAAAPDMLEALQAMANIIDYDRTQEEVPTWDCTCEPNDTCPPCKVEKAIKLALGTDSGGGKG
jgi:hypothetical protein